MEIKHLVSGVSGGGEGEERSGKRREQKERKRMATAVRVVGLKKAKK